MDIHIGCKSMLGVKLVTWCYKYMGPYIPGLLRVTARFVCICIIIIICVCVYVCVASPAFIG